jgi:hypothetical protein
LLINTNLARQSGYRPFTLTDAKFSLDKKNATNSEWNIKRLLLLPEKVKIPFLYAY